MKNYLVLTKKAFGLMVGLVIAMQPAFASSSDNYPFLEVKQKQTTQYKDWKKAISKEGKCSAVFPKSPEHIRQKIPMKGEEKELQYYVYVADFERKAVYMMLIAEYPGVVSDENAVKNLEHFLNTLIAQNASNKLLFADLIDVAGYPGMDFFIQSDQIYFKGRAIQANNTLYLLAMECEVINYSEENCQYFIDSFQLDK
jgi:hypothetical protein